ncbi:MAG: STAS domain-containing protein [Acidobacteriota bacterium]
MDLEIHQRIKEGMPILDLRGYLVIGPSEATLRETIIALASAGTVSVILNCARVVEIDEDGLGALIYCSAKLREAGGELKLLNLKHVHLKLIVRAELDTAFQMFSDEQDAVNSFFPDRAILAVSALIGTEAAWVKLRLLGFGAIAKYGDVQYSAMAPPEYQSFIPSTA